MLFVTTAYGKRHRLKLGDSAPKWEELKGIDDKEHSLDQFEKAKLMVVVFAANNCPVAQLYEERISKVARDYKTKGVAVVAINSNKDESRSAMKKYAKQKKLGYIYLKDETQRVAKSFGALMTPEVFVFDGQRKLAYMGGIDDDRLLTGKPKRNYLRDAIDALLANKKPPKAETRAFGCTIRWK